MKKNGLLVVLAIAILGVFVLAGCGQSAAPAEEPSDNKTLVMGIDDSFPPMGFRDENNEIVGFDIDLAKEVAKRLDMELKVQVINWDTKELELDNDKIDCIWNGLTITPEREEAMEFSKPYLENDQIIMVQNNSSIATKADLEGKKVGLQKGSSAFDALSADPIAQKIADGKPVEFDENVSAFQDLASGRIDAVVVDKVVAGYYISSEKADFTILEESLSPELYGIAFKKGNIELRDAVQKAIDEMVADGTAGKIATQWFSSDIFYKGE